MRVVQLLPRRAVGEQNTLQETKALEAAGYEVLSVGAPRPGAAGLLWLEAVGWRKAIRLKPDIVVARDLDALGAAVRVKRRTGAKVVYDMHEVYPWMIANDVPSAIVRRAEERERKLLPKVDLALTCNLGYANWLHEQWVKVGTGIDPAWDLHVVVNCRDPVVPYVPIPDTNTLCYTGTLHPSRFIKEMFEAMQNIDGQLLIAGPRTPGSLYDWLEKWSPKVPSSVQFLGQISPEQSLRVLQRSDISIMMVDPMVEMHRHALANRLFDAMAAGRPAIGTVGTATGDLLSTVKMGITAMYDADSYIEAVHTLLELTKQERERLSINAYDACVKTFNWASEAKKMVAAYEAL